MKISCFETKRFKGFTLAEMLVVAAISLIVMASIPAIVMFSRTSTLKNPNHGEIRCYYGEDSDGNITLQTMKTGTEPQDFGIDPNDGRSCVFTPPKGARKFVVQVNPATGSGASVTLNQNPQSGGSAPIVHDDINIFNIKDISHEIMTPYTVTYPDTTAIRNNLGAERDFADDATLDSIVSGIANELNSDTGNHRITVRLRAPNGVRPRMQYWRPNAGYSHYRGLAIGGNFTIAQNKIVDLSFSMPWPNLIRYPLIGLFGTLAIGENDTRYTDGTAFPTFKEMFVGCSGEYLNGQQATEGFPSCYDQCGATMTYDNIVSYNSTNVIRAKADPYLQCDVEGIANCLGGDNVERGTFSILTKNDALSDATHRADYTNLPYPVYSRVMMVVFKDPSITRETFLRTVSLTFNGLAGLGDNACSLLPCTDRIKGVIQQEKDIADAANAAIYSNRLPTYRNEKANVNMLNQDTRNNATQIFKNPMSACTFRYITKPKGDTVNPVVITVPVLNPEYNVTLQATRTDTYANGKTLWNNPDSGSRPFNNPHFISNDGHSYDLKSNTAMGDVIYPVGYPRGAYICGVARPFQFSYLGIDWGDCGWQTINHSTCISWECECTRRGKYTGWCLKRNYNNCWCSDERTWTTREYRCTRPPSIGIQTADTGFYDINNHSWNVAGVDLNLLNKMFQARCYSPYIYDKQTLYEQQLSDYGSFGGQGASKTISRRLADGLNMQFSIPAHRTNDGSGTASSDHPYRTWGQVVIPSIDFPRTNGPYEYRLITDHTDSTNNIRRQIFYNNQRLNASDSRVRISGIKSGLCDGDFERGIAVQRVRNDNAISGDSALDRNSGFTLMTRMYTVSGIDEFDENYSDVNSPHHRGETIQVTFNKPSSAGGEEENITLRVTAGSSGDNGDTLSELPTTLMDIPTFENAVMTVINRYTSVNPQNLREALRAIFGRANPSGGVNGNATISARFTDANNQVTTKQCQTTSTQDCASSNTNSYGNYRISNLTPIPMYNGELNGSSGANAEIEILKNHGGGSARLVCDENGDSRSTKWTGTPDNPNIEIIPGRIWVQITTIGTNSGDAGLIGENSPRQGEKIGIVKTGAAIPTFTITPGEGGIARPVNSTCSDEDRRNYSIGYTCKGNPGGRTNVSYSTDGNHQTAVQFGGKFGLTQEEGVPGGEGGKRGRTVDAAEAARLMHQANQAHNNEEGEDGTGAEGTLGHHDLETGAFVVNANRIYVRLFFGDGDPNGTCVYDSHVNNLRSSDACNPDANFGTFTKEAGDGRGASVRIVW